MKYLATFDPTGLKISNVFNTLFEAEEWLDSMNNNLEYTTMIDIIDEDGHKKDGFFYTMAAR